MPSTTKSASRAGVVCGEQDIGLVFGGKNDRSLTAFHGRFDGFCQAGAAGCSDLQTINDDFNIVLDLPFERKVIGNRHDLAIDPGTHESGPTEFSKEILVFAFLTSNHWG